MSIRSIPLLVAGALASPLLAGPSDVVIFAFTQGTNTVLRIQDLNGDGDTLDPGEVTRFMDTTFGGVLGISNAQGLYALGPNEVLATDNFPPDNILRLRDDNTDGDAYDPGESSVFWNGDTFGGLTLTNPTCLMRAHDGSYYTVDNNQLDTTRPEAIYRLRDLNNNGTVNDPGEVELWKELAPIGSTTESSVFDVEVDAAGNAYVFDISSPARIDRIDEATRTRANWLTAGQLVTLRNLTLDISYKLTRNPATDEIIAPAFNINSRLFFVALKDLNGSNTIDQSGEIRIIWSELANADGRMGMGAPRDIFWGPDGSLLFVESVQRRVWRLVDLNSDGDFNDLGETTIAYDSNAAVAAGLPAGAQLLSVSMALVPPPAPCLGDANGDNQIDAADLSVLLANFGQPAAGPAFGDFNGDGQCDGADLSVLLAQFGSTCP